jgi:hypothetical protein
VLAKAARLAESRRLGAASPRDLEATWREKRHRLVTSEPGCLEHPGKKGGAKTGPNPTDRGKKGSKHHLLTDAQGIPLTSDLTAANVNETTTLSRMLDKVPLLPKPGAPPRRRPAKLHADKGYASK